MATVNLDTTVKGGLPVTVEAQVLYCPFDREHYIDEIDVYWKSGKRVTPTVHDSIPQDDWDRIEYEILNQ